MKSDPVSILICW